MFTDCTENPENCAAAVALLPPAGAGSIVTDGVVVYPVPALVISILMTFPFEITAVAVAFTPPGVEGADKVTLGAEVYPEPMLIIFTRIILPVPPICADTAAPVPPEMVMVGGAVYPVPGLVKLIAVTTPLVTTAVAVAPVQPPPNILTRGADVYPVPPDSILIRSI